MYIYYTKFIKMSNLVQIPIAYTEKAFVKQRLFQMRALVDAIGTKIRENKDYIFIADLRDKNVETQNQK